MTTSISRWVTPTEIPIAEVIAGDRSRKNFGDLPRLMQSIQELGLLQPIGIVRGNHLLFGGRRLEACRRLGWDLIPFVVPSCRDDALALLEAERDENTQREPMTVGELVDLGLKLERLERPKAHERMAEGARSRWVGSPDPTLSVVQADLPTAEIVSKALGLSSATYKRAKVVAQVASGAVTTSADAKVTAEQALARLNAGETSVMGAYNQVREALVEQQPPSEPKHYRDRSANGRDLRNTRIRALAAKACTSRQIAEMVGLSFGGLRAICRREHIDIPADKAVGKTRKIDSTRIAREVVTGLEGTVMALDLMNYDDIDLREAAYWATSLKASVKALNLFRKRIEEMTQ